MSERKPIILSPNDIALIKIYSSNGFPEDLWTYDFDCYTRTIDCDDGYLGYESAAQQFIEQLQDRWCVAFMVALRDKIQGLLDGDPAYEDWGKKIQQYTKVDKQNND